jgi:hypothetical protein
VSAIADEQPSVRSCATTLAAQHDLIVTGGAELYHRLDLALRDESIDRGEVGRLGYTYCTELRRSMLFEESTLDETRSATGHHVLERPRADDEAQYRARFDRLARRIGCGCPFGER